MPGNASLQVYSEKLNGGKTTYHVDNNGLARTPFYDQVPGASTVPTGLTTMGYYRQSDCLAFYRALADAFTICDGYHCSVIGPTDPNRLYSMSATIDPDGDDGGQPFSSE